MWDPDGDSCNQLDCLLLACRQLWFCKAVGVAVASQLEQQVGLLKIVSNGLWSVVTWKDDP